MERNNFTYIMRNGEIEHIWQYRIIVNGFDTYLYVRGTESEVRDYIESEYPHDKSWHHALTEKEVEMIGKLCLTVYIAPKLK